MGAGNSYYELTKNPKALADIIQTHACREDARLRFRRMTWVLAWWYMNGARKFDVFDLQTGAVLANYVDNEGRLEFQSQELMFLLNKVASRLSAMDYRPKVNTVGGSLQGVRERSIAQVELDSFIKHDQLLQASHLFSWTLTSLGAVGITGHVTDHPTIGLMADLEVVHPREVMPFPSISDTLAGQRGIMRSRYVPSTILKRKYGEKKITSHTENMEYYDTTAGDLMNQTAWEIPTQWGLNRGISPLQPATEAPDEQIRVFLTRELWLDGPGGTCSRYVVSSGKTILEDEDFSGTEMYCPLGWARFFNNGSFHGLGCFDMMFPLARQLELMLKRLFNNIRDLDNHGILIAPAGQWNDKTALKTIPNGPRYLPFYPDPANPDFKPYAIEPVNTGEMPGKVASFARTMLRDLDPTPDLADNKGRVDSFSGLQFLDEQMQQSLGGPAQAAERAFSQCYRASLTAANALIARSPRPIPVSRLTLDLAGAVIDPETMTVSFSQNPIPDISRLLFSVRDTSAKSDAAKKQEAIALLEKGISDPASLILFCLDNGIELAMYLDPQKSAYNAVIRNILLVYGDGITPGQVVLTPETVRPDIQIHVLEGFLGDPRVAQASPAVIDQLARYKQTLLQFTGAVLPPGVPNPDEFAMMNQMQPQQGAPPGMGMGQPPLRMAR